MKYLGSCIRGEDAFDGEQAAVLGFGDGAGGFLDDVEVGDEFPVAGDEEAGAGGNLFAVGVGQDQQHDGRSGFLGERLEVYGVGGAINGLRLRADGGRLVDGE